MRKKRLMIKIIVSIFALVAVLLAPALAAPPAAMTETLAPMKIKHVFDITRDGGKIGTDIVEIEKQGDVTNVKFTTHISVVIMFVQAYHLDHTSVETWNGNQFVSFKSQTDDNGKKRSLSATVVGDKIRFDIDGKRSEAPRTLLPASFWNRNFVTANELFHEDDGKRMSIKVADLGDEILDVQGRKHQVRHYQISGDLQRDLWFEGDTLLRLSLTGSDGSKIVSDLRS